MAEPEPSMPSTSAGLDAVEAIGRSFVAHDEQTRDRWDRSLSFSDAVVDRWERARRLGFAQGSSIYGSALVYGQVDVGVETWVGPWVLLDGSGGELHIGAFCSISAGVHIYTHDTVEWAISGGLLPRRTATVRIGDRCHIGAQTVVTAGVTIGDGCVVGSNSLVNRDVAPASVVVGSPARVVGHVEGEGTSARLRFEPPPEP
jgi:acetyltransferase-like isoleucine patch superfamily enzyme